MMIQQQVTAFVRANDLQFFLDGVTLVAAARRARTAGIPGTLKSLNLLLKTARIDECVYWGKRLKPRMRQSNQPDAYWEKLREAARRYEPVLKDLFPKHAEQVLRLAVPTNITLMRGLTKQHRVWKESQR